MIPTLLWAFLQNKKLESGHALPGKWKTFVALLVSWGPGGLFLLAMLDSAGLPVVGGVDLLLVNVAAMQPSMAFTAAICAITGSLLGSIILFTVARKGGELMLGKYISTRAGRRLHAWFERYGMVTIFIPALSPLPLPMKIPVFCAGALEVRWLKFLVVVLTARSLRYFGLAFFAARYGVQTLQFLRQHLFSVSLIATGLAATAVIVLQIREHRRRAQRGAVPTAS